MRTGLSSWWVGFTESFGFWGALLLVVTACLAIAVVTQAVWWAFRHIRQEIREMRIQRLYDEDAARVKRSRGCRDAA